MPPMPAFARDVDADPGPTGAWSWAARAACWVAGIGLQLRQPALWPGEAYPLLLAGGLGLALLASIARRRSPPRGCAIRSKAFARWAPWLAAAAMGFAFAGWRADVRLRDALAPEWEGCDIELVGVVDEMPQVAEDGQHVAFVVESARALAMTDRDLRHVAALDAATGGAMSASVRSTIAQAVEQARRRDAEPEPEEGEGHDLDLDTVEPPGADANGSPRDDPAVGSPAPVGETPRVPSRVWLSWSGNQRDDRTVAATPAPLRAGQRWRLPVRLRLPHGAMNPDGFDAEFWLFDQDLRATGTVRGPGALLSQGWSPIENARQWVRDRLLAGATGGVDDARAAGALAALAVGDQAAIDSAGWEVFRNTGVAHLMSISGLHITMLGWLGGRAIGAAWRRGERAALGIAAPVAARWGGVLVAWTYALLAGWGVPAQRTVVMLAATALLRGAGLNWSPVLVTLAAMVPVTLLDPWALLQPGFWLSFAAVALLMVSEPVRPAAPEPVPMTMPVPLPDGATSMADGTDDRPMPASGGADRPSAWSRLPGALVRQASRALRALRILLGDGVRAQVVASVGLAPLTLVAFQQVSLVGLLSNLVAEPWITLVVTPLALAGVLVPPLWQLAALALRPLLWLLAELSRWPFASVHVAVAPAWVLAAGLLGGAVAMLPVPRRIRLLGLPMLLPLAWPVVERPPAGWFELVAADVGQGSAVLVRTERHLLLFDTGPRFGEIDDAGRRLLLPLLQARGEPRIDVLVLSHADADHVGGAQSLIDRLPVLALRSSLDARNPLRRNPLPHVACAAGQSWRWDGVDFRMLHPLPADYRPGAKTNAVSCVLRVSDAAGRSALLTGDIEAPQEAALVARDGPALRSDVLVVPHHGSRTSSTEDFLRAVRPRVAVIQVGYRSRYGHPVPAVLARYRANGIAVVRTDHCGAWSWRDDDAVCTRAVRRRYWSWQGLSGPLTPARITTVPTSTSPSFPDLPTHSP